MEEDQKGDRLEIQHCLDKVTISLEAVLRVMWSMQVKQELLEAANKLLKSTIKEVLETGHNNHDRLESASKIA